MEGGSCPSALGSANEGAWFSCSRSDRFFFFSLEKRWTNVGHLNSRYEKEKFNSLQTRQDIAPALSFYKTTTLQLPHKSCRCRHRR